MFYGKKSLVPLGTDGFVICEYNLKGAKVRFLYQNTNPYSVRAFHSFGV